MTAGAWDDNRNFDFFLSYLEALGATGGAPLIPADERALAHEEFGGDRPPNATLDVAILFDTTGSMGDELSYLVDELQTIAARIEDAAPNADTRWALVLYRDHGDAYVTRTIDFTDDLAAFQETIAAQSADGGGDYPEAVEAVLAEATELSWRSSADVARLAYWIADAPHHAQDAPQVTTSLLALRDLDVHVYPVAASGADALVELTMRGAAQLTGGRYLFITDDSGIGGAHAEPTIPCYFVTTLAAAMVRMVSLEMTGVYAEPAVEEVIRSGGDPQDGRCTLADGETVAIL